MVSSFLSWGPCYQMSYDKKCRKSKFKCPRTKYISRVIFVIRHFIWIVLIRRFQWDFEWQNQLMVKDFTGILNFGFWQFCRKTFDKTGTCFILYFPEPLPLLHYWTMRFPVSWITSTFYKVYMILIDCLHGLTIDWLLSMVTRIWSSPRRVKS